MLGRILYWTARDSGRAIAAGRAARAAGDIRRTGGARPGYVGPMARRVAKDKAKRAAKSGG